MYYIHSCDICIRNMLVSRNKYTLCMTLQKEILGEAHKTYFPMLHIVIKSVKLLQKSKLPD